MSSEFTMVALARRLSSLLPLSSAVFLLAITVGCVIITGDDASGDEACIDLDAVCPNLVCETEQVVVDGCPICECAAVCEPGPAPECAGARVLDDCTWTCEIQECQADGDCGDGFFCSADNGTLPSDPGAPAQDPPEAAPVSPGGVCLPIERPLGCFADADCASGFFCDVSNAGGGASDPLPPPPDGGGERPIPPPQAGICAPISVCFSDVDCAPTAHCEFPGAADALVAVGGVCVDNTVVSCASDFDCSAGSVCVNGTCAQPAQPCFNDAECQAGEFCDFDTAGRVACPDVNGDSICDEPTPAIEGVCHAIAPASCTSDVDCAHGQLCQLTDQCVCTTECIDDGMGGCLPCDCPANSGVCIDIVITPCATVRCTADTTCQVDADGLASCVPNAPPCTSDVDCAQGQVCELIDQCVCTRECIDDGMGGCLPCDCPPSSGVCIDIVITPCATVRCTADTTCQVDADGLASCVPNDPLCTSDDVCAAGTHCNAADICLPDPACAAGDACIAVCQGHCVETACAADADCPDTQTCVFDVAGGAARPIVAPQGFCRTGDPTITPCATVRCSSGTTCEVNAAGNAECVPDAPVCSSDDMCAAGTVCNAADVCLPDPACMAGGPCIDACYGFCVAPAVP